MKQWLLWSVTILLVAAVLRMIHLSDTSLTTDESLTYARTQGSLQDRLEHIAEPGNQVPLYYLSLELLPHDSDFELRYSSVLWALLGIALLMAIARRLHNLGIWVGILAAFSPYLVLYARTARPYPLLFFSGLLASWLFYKIILGQASKWTWIAFIAWSMVAYLTHYSAAALPLTQFVILMWYRRNPLPWIGAQAIASLPTFLWVALYATPRGDPNDWIAIPNIGRPYYTITNILVGYEANPTWYFLIALVVITPALYLGIRFALRSPQVMDRYWLVLAFVPLLLVFLISQVRPLYVERYFMVTSPAVFLIVLLGLRQWRARYFVLGTSIVIGVSAGVTLAELATNHFESLDWSESVATMQADFQARDGVIIDAAHKTVFWRYYDHEIERVAQSDVASQLYEGNLTLRELPYERFWLFINADASESVRSWLAEQSQTSGWSFHKIELYLLEP